jgi:flagellar biosynthesis protein FlhA
MDNLGLKVREYVISLKGVEVSRYELPQGCELAISTARTAPQLEGMRTREPAFGIAAVWIPSERSEAARNSGYTVVDGVSVLGTHLSEIIRKHAHELFSRADAKKVLDRVTEENPKAVEDLVPKLLSLATVQKVLQNLLRERVSIRDANTIMEALGEAAGMTRNPILLTEYVRQSIRRMLVKPYLNQNGDLPAYFLDPGLERTIEGAIEHTENTSNMNLPPQAIRNVLDRISKTVGAVENPMVAVAGSASRYFLRQLVESTIPNLTILSHSEIPAGVKVVSLGVVQ